MFIKVLSNCTKIKMFSKRFMLQLLFVVILFIQSRSGMVNQTQYWFDDQKIDHFNPQDNETFSQRFWMIDQYFNSSPASNSPVILYICGEYTCGGIPGDRLFPIDLAEKYNALILVLEHRYYGKSIPVSDLSVENLKYLTVAQALEDLAFFINWCQNNNNLSIGQNRKWISYGGSYPGALSAWFRYKYPHLTVGAVASSSIVNSILDFDDFDHRVYLSMMKSGPKCVENFQEISKYVEKVIYSTEAAAEALKKGYNCANFPNDEFLWLFADGVAEIVQYGGRTTLCQLLDAPTFEERYQNIKQVVVNRTNPKDYGSYYLKNTTIDPNNDGGRQWTWQFCSEVAAFNTNYKDPSQSMRSSMLNLTFWYSYCERIFGYPLKPKSSVFNNVYGGVNLDVQNLIIVNGCEDPWQGESLLENQDEVHSFYVDCENCAHCVELYTPSPNDSWSLWWTRTKIYYHFDKWING